MGKQLRAIIDTSTIVEIERKRYRLRAARRHALSSIVLAELFAGLLQEASASNRDRRAAFLERLIDSMPVLPFSLRAARAAYEAAEHLRAIGRPIGQHDLWIAGTALAHGYAILTHDRRSYPHIPGLTVHEV